jgi:ribosomal protein L14
MTGTAAIQSVRGRTATAHARSDPGTISLRGAAAVVIDPAGASRRVAVVGSAARPRDFLQVSPSFSPRDAVA